MPSERRPVADEPDVPEGIDEPALAVRSPRRSMHLYLVTACRRTGRECVRNECVRIITEDFDAYDGMPSFSGLSQPLFEGSPKKNAAP